MTALLTKICKTLVDKAPAATAAAGAGLMAAWGPMFALLLLDVVNLLQEKNKSKQLGELATRLKKLQAGPQLAADAIARLEDIPIDDLPDGDLRLIYLVLYRFLRGVFDANRSSLDDLAAALDRMEDDHKQRWNTLLIREFPRLREALNLSRDDLAGLIREHNALRQAIERHHEEVLKRLDALAIVPPLEFTLLVPDKATRFAYRAQRVPLFGREAEMEALRAFLGPCPPDAVDFRWWFWTGPGGAGKSRLAWELCLEAESRGWRVGFLEDEVTFDDWHRWRVERPTLMIVDYCAKRPDQVRKAILGLTNHVGNIHAPARILLLERSADPQDAWWSQFERGGSTSRSAQLREFIYWPGPKEDRPDPLHQLARPLEPPGDDALWSIIAAVFEEKRKPPPAREDVLKVLRGIDPQGRPLFALLAAETLRERGLDAIRQWDAPTLTNSILEHEFARWRQECGVSDGPSEAFERHLNLLTFVTIVGPQPFEVIDHLVASGANVPASRRDFELDWWHRYLGYAADPHLDRLAPLTPNFLGELFVLLRLNGTLHAARNPRFGPPEDTRTLWRTAWTRFPLATASFLNRAARDFPDRPDLLGLARMPIEDASPVGAESSPEELFSTWFSIGVTLDLYFKDHVGALSAFDRVVALRSDHPSTQHNRGVALAELGRHEEALDAFDRAIALRPGHPDTHYNRGVSLNELSRHEEAVEAYNSVIALRPEDPDTHYNRGILLAGLGRHEEALDAFDRAIALRPGHPDTHYNRGASLDELGRYEDAVAAYGNAIALRPDDPDTHHNRGVSLDESGRCDEAVAAYDHAIALRPDDPDTHHNRGNSLVKLGRLNEALSAFDRVIELRPDDLDSHRAREIILGMMEE